MSSKTKLALLEIDYANAKTEEEKLSFFSDIILEIRNEDADKALVLNEELFERSKAINYQLGIGNAYNHKGACYWIKGEYEEGLDELAEAYSIARDIENASLEAKVLNNFGRIYRELGDISNALVHFEEALEINEKRKNIVNQSINLTNIANLYLDLADYDSALEYALKALPIFQKEQDPAKLISNYNTLANIYYWKEMYPDALDYFQKLQKLSSENSPNMPLANSGLGKVYFKMKEFDKAAFFLELALNQATQTKNYEIEILAKFYIAHLYEYNNKLDEALNYYHDAFKLANELSRKQDLVSIHERLSEIYDHLKDIPKAYYHLKAYEKLKEEIFHQKTYDKMRNLQVKNKIEVAKKEKEVAEKTAMLKQQFMANMSHEIRTPMNAIVGITRLLIKKENDGEQLRYLNLIQRSADNLLVIINDILDLSKIEANKIIIESIPFSLRELLDQHLEMMIVKAEEKKLDFDISVEEGVPDNLLGDPTRLNQVLINLVGNAIKFTEKGSVKINVVLTNTTNNQVNIKFYIKDTGIGISKQYINTIFESFTQAGTDTARKFGGTGLGLTISKQLVDLMKGRIEVDSELEHGTTFKITIPFILADNIIPTNSKGMDLEILKNNLKGAKILLVEDNEFNQVVAVDTLKSEIPELNIELAENGKEAIAMILENDYDVVLMDILMPVMDGIAATKYIRKELPDNKKDIKIVAMTANVLQDDVKHYFDIGMNGYVAKPFHLEDLLLALNDQKKLIINNGHVDDDHHASKTLLFPDHITDMSFLKQFTSNNKEKRNKYINMFLDNCPKLLKKINEALEQKDFPTMKVAAHSLKPQLGYMGVKEEVSNIYLIEHSAAEEQAEVLPSLVKHLNKLSEQIYLELHKVLEEW
ncbi:MAG TPA: tetratricopeptide repeat protein [Edaphocola sp.]|nr:tetratricopeptide repeat protein [Edaphocola sp.]